LRVKEKFVTRRKLLKIEIDSSLTKIVLALLKSKIEIVFNLRNEIKTSLSFFFTQIHN